MPLMLMKHLRSDLLLITYMSHSRIRRWHVAVRFARISFFAGSRAKRWIMESASSKSVSADYISLSNSTPTANVG